MKKLSSIPGGYLSTFWQAMIKGTMKCEVFWHCMVHKNVNCVNVHNSLSWPAIFGAFLLCVFDRKIRMLLFIMLQAKAFYYCWFVGCMGRNKCLVWHISNVILFVSWTKTDLCWYCSTFRVLQEQLFHNTCYHVSTPTHQKNRILDKYCCFIIIPIFVWMIRYVYYLCVFKQEFLKLQLTLMM